MATRAVYTPATGAGQAAWLALRRSWIFTAITLACSPTRESLGPPGEGLPELVFPPAAVRQATCVAHGPTVRCENLTEVREVEIGFDVKSATGTTGGGLCVKSGDSFLMINPAVEMSREEWEDISYYRSLDGPNERGPWFDEFPGGNAFLRNALLSVCAVAPPRDPFCSATSAFFDFVGTADVVELVFGLQVACVLLADERLLCHGPAGRREESGVIDVDVGTSSICTATRTEFECWPIPPVTAEG